VVNLVLRTQLLLQEHVLQEYVLLVSDNILKIERFKIKSKKFIYKNSVKWEGERKGRLFCADKPDIQIAPPPEFKGYPGIWTPEDLFIATVNSCIMTTFLYYAEREGLKFLSYESQVQGVLERVGREFMFSTIKIMPKILIEKDCDVHRIKEVIKLSEKYCFISNSIKSKVEITPEIKIKV